MKQRTRLEVLKALRDDLRQRGTKDSSGITVVEVSDSIWRDFTALIIAMQLEERLHNNNL